jgi:hypothetical protein
MIFDFERLRIQNNVHVSDTMETDPYSTMQIPMGALGMSPTKAQEQEERRLRQSWRLLQQVMTTFNTHSDNGAYKGRPGTQILLSKDSKGAEYFHNSNQFDYVIRDDLPDVPTKLLEPLINFSRGTLRFHCTGSIRQSNHEQCALALIDHLLKPLQVMKRELKVKSLVVSWDHCS